MSDRPFISIIVPVFNGVELAANFGQLAAFTAGDYVQRIYRQSSGRPFYLVRRDHDSAPTAGALQ